MSIYRLGCTVLGILSVLPLLSVLILLLYVHFHPGALDAIASAGNISPSLYAGPVWGLQAAAAGLVLGFALYIFYLFWTVRTSTLTATGKAGWIVLLSVAGLFAMPVLWWRHFRVQRQQ